MSKSHKKKDCSCRNKSPGRPKYSHGCCYHAGDLRPAVQERRQGQRYLRRWRDEYDQ